MQLYPHYWFDRLSLTVCIMQSLDSGVCMLWIHFLSNHYTTDNNTNNGMHLGHWFPAAPVHLFSHTLTCVIIHHIKNPTQLIYSYNVFFLYISGQPLMWNHMHLIHNSLVSGKMVKVKLLEGWWGSDVITKNMLQV